MNLDLGRALEEIADEAGALADLGPASGLVQRRRRRRVVRRTVGGTLAIAVVGGLALAGSAIGWVAPDPQPAVTGPAPTPSASASASGTLPGCGDTLPRLRGALTVTAPPEVTRGGAVPVVVTDTGGVADDADPVRVVLVDDGRVVAFADVATPDWEDTSTTPELRVDAAPEPCGELPDELTLTAVVLTQEGPVVADAVPLTLTAPEEGPDPGGTDQGQGTAPADGADGAGGGRPLADPDVPRWDGVTSIVSDIPVSGDDLADGDYLADVVAVDPQARTITADIVVFYGGDAADEWLRVNEPEAAAELGGRAVSGYIVVNDVTRLRTLALAPDAPITGFCVDSEGLRQPRRTLEDLTTPEPSGGCHSSSVVEGSPGMTMRYFWLDVRDGVVAQLVGQYVP
ncbi:hypothetical protein [Cellulomonas sp. C5510]|uniref:hypothetical protein n=1 Tax=Cellulomonas sp. C5510 TaxID=2871170 RepID=UPI001C957855|nr:hypothetical protein [Cellulomonas sp. C5510]QZN85943.1 hypothetical protein K5O09_01605 [Cellulomonas sp. C5510]